MFGHQNELPAHHRQRMRRGRPSRERFVRHLLTAHARRHRCVCHAQTRRDPPESAEYSAVSEASAHSELRGSAVAASLAALARLSLEDWCEAARYAPASAYPRGHTRSMQACLTTRYGAAPENTAPPLRCARRNSRLCYQPKEILASRGIPANRIRRHRDCRGRRYAR